MTMKNHFSNHRAMGMRKNQTGITLIESLIALVVAALGILGVVGVQMRTLVDTQASVNRGYAISLIDDLAERIQTNPDALNNLPTYTTSPTSATDCTTTACDPAALATYDIKSWRDQVSTTLPGSQAIVFVPQGGSRQLGVLIGWADKHYSQTGASLSASDVTALDAELMKIIPANTKDSTGAAVSCPDGLICHLQYIQPTQRCTPWGIGAGTLYCAS